MVQIVKMMNEHHYRSFSFCSCFHVGNLARLPLTRNVFSLLMYLLILTYIGIQSGLVERWWLWPLTVIYRCQWLWLGEWSSYVMLLGCCTA